MEIRSLAPHDHDAWRVLWLQYLGHHGIWPEEAPPETWPRLMSAERRMEAIGAFDGDALVGFAHYLFHPHPWWSTEVCLLADVFTAPSLRRSGIARAMVAAVFARAAARGADHVYGTTLAGNTGSHRLYDQVAEQLPLLVYRHQLPRRAT